MISPNGFDFDPQGVAKHSFGMVFSVHMIGVMCFIPK